VSELLTRLREACARVAERAAHVAIDRDAIPAYAADLALDPSDAEHPPGSATREQLAAYWLTLDAINFGSGWFPTLRKPGGRSGYQTIAQGLTDHGPWPPDQLRRIDAAEVARALGQDPAHELMELFARSLRDLGAHAEAEGGFEAVVTDSAAGIVERLAGWECFADTSWYGELEIPFLKRAQIVASDLHRAGVARVEDLGRLTMFADNLVPHVLRLDGVLSFAPALVDRIERHQLIEHGSPEEVEIRACAVHAVELIVAARPGAIAAKVDELLWLRGGQHRYKAVPRHRSRCTAY
jgi:Queuosine salvage protein